MSGEDGGEGRGEGEGEERGDWEEERRGDSKEKKKEKETAKRSRSREETKGAEGYTRRGETEGARKALAVPGATYSGSAQSR